MGFFKKIRRSEFCKSVLKIINEEKPANMVHILSSLNIFYEDNAILSSLYSHGYCMGALEIELSRNNDYNTVEEVLREINERFAKYVLKNLVQPNIPSKNTNALINDILTKNNLKSSFVKLILSSDSSDNIEVITSSYLQDIGVSYFDIKSNEAMEQVQKAMKDMITFNPIEKL